MENLSFPQKVFLIGLGVVVAIILIVYVFTKDNSTTAFQEVVLNNEFSDENNVQQEIKHNIIVHVAGEVENEGVIELEANSRVNDAVEAAGGVTSEADLSHVNLADFLKDGQKIYIPSKDEVETEYSVEVNGKNDFMSDFVEVGKVNINTASQSDLETLSGIGPSTALKIINYRKQNGNFSSIEDIMNVPGIGESKFESIKDDITVN